MNRGEWKTIDSAPKDGTPILILCEVSPVRVMLVGFYGPATDKSSYEPVNRQDFADRETWRVKLDDMPIDCGYDATHWQPLPEPPEPTDGAIAT